MDKLSLRELLKSDFKMRFPVRFFGINQWFGENKFTIVKNGKRISYYKSIGLKGHGGLDFATPVGEKLYAPFDGIVDRLSFDSENGGYGNTIYLISKQQKYKETPFRMRATFAHLEEIGVKEGDLIKTGDYLGICDNTGMSSGYHLHFTLKPYFRDENGVFIQDRENGFRGAIDPFPFFRDKIFEGYIEYWKKTWTSLYSTLPPVLDHQVLPVDVRYWRYWDDNDTGKRPWHTYVSEKKVLYQLGLKGLKAGRDFTDREIRALVYGGWGFEDVFGSTGIAQTKTWMYRKKYN